MGPVHECTTSVAPRIRVLGRDNSCLDPCSYSNSVYCSCSNPAYYASSCFSIPVDLLDF
ncbi:hypothetical protein SLEP1_g28663 [Rubroshorea leprosula]|uniref:Uncharacterized protein n=1 Tax=Rubroshorea leprosula TaxID=152421 RepID=A0AAV5K439_9ROSI|nr:hypothetical protein SLEP1_g28663 [Rubroshorea leprosula]